MMNAYENMETLVFGDIVFNVSIALVLRRSLMNKSYVFTVDYRPMFGR